jgi:hypothetical protein
MNKFKATINSGANLFGRQKLINFKVYIKNLFKIVNLIKLNGDLLV